MRSITYVAVAVACLIVPGLSRVEARTVPAAVQAYRQGGEHERQEERRENRVDRKEAKRQLNSARAIINRIRPDRDEGIPRDSLEQVKARFNDLYKDFNENNGRRAERERRDWQADYSQIQQLIDNLNVRDRGEGAIGTTGRRDEERGRRDDLAQLREHLDAFYNAAAGHEWRRQERQ
jgi:hypothetical protein